MRIQLEHFYHGAALTQIVEDPRVTSIRSLTYGRNISKSAYRINGNIAVYVKYSGKPNKSHREYVFQFSRSQRTEMEAISKHIQKFFVALVCVKGCEICCVEYSEILKMFNARRKSKGAVEAQIAILVTLPKGNQFRVYVNAPQTKNMLLGEELLVPRNAFPELIFSKE